MPENRAAIAAYNAIRGEPYAFANGMAESAGFEWANVSDYLDYTLFNWSGALNSTVVVTTTKSSQVSCLVLWPVNVLEDTVFSVWTYIAAVGQPRATITLEKGRTRPKVVYFPAVELGVGDSFEIFRSTAGSIITFRQVYFGDFFQPPRGQWVGVNPTTQASTIVTDMTISVNGSVLGRTVRRVDRSFNLDLSPVPREWAFSTWQEFQLHMTRFACFLQWSPIEYPDDVVFAVASEIVPSEQMAGQFLHCKMPLRVLI